MRKHNKNSLCRSHLHHCIAEPKLKDLIGMFKTTATQNKSKANLERCTFWAKPLLFKTIFDQFGQELAKKKVKRPYSFFYSIAVFLIISSSVYFLRTCMIMGHFVLSQILQIYSLSFIFQTIKIIQMGHPDK